MMLTLIRELTEGNKSWKILRHCYMQEMSKLPESGAVDCVTTQVATRYDGHISRILCGTHHIVPYIFILEWCIGLSLNSWRGVQLSVCGCDSCSVVHMSSSFSPNLFTPLHLGTAYQ